MRKRKKQEKIRKMVVLQKIKVNSPAMSCMLFFLLENEDSALLLPEDAIAVLSSGLWPSFAKQPADTVYFCCLYRQLGEDPSRARSQFFIADLCRCPTSRAFVSAEEPADPSVAARCRFSIPNLKTMAWRAPFGKLAGRDDSHLCQQPICSCLRGRVRTQKTQIRRCRIERYTFVFSIQAANLSFQSPHRAAKRQNLRAADHGRRWYSWVFAKVGQSIWQGGGKFPLILICLEHPWQHTVRATIVLGQNLI